MKLLKRIFTCTLALGLVLSLASCAKTGGGTASEVIIYSNCDEEAKLAMQGVLDENGYAGKYIFQSFGTSELGGKLLAEGKNIEADMISMSSYYIESAQSDNNMFLPLGFDYTPLLQKRDFYAPVVAPEGAIIVNTEVLAANNLTMPSSLKDLSKPEYAGKIAIVDIMGSSTAWLMVQAILVEYGEAEGAEVLRGIYKNAGAHMESSGAGPLKKVRAGEVAIGFGLRHQAVNDKLKGLPIAYVDPTEGNYSLQEGIALIDKGEKTNPLAAEMAECIIKNVRPEMQKTYPVAIYEGETVTGEQKSAYPKSYPAPLTVALLKEHQAISESVK